MNNMTQNKKRVINLGSGVDSGDGNTLRKGGETINHNIDNIYNRLGDGEKLLTSGAWHNIQLKDADSKKVYKAEFGDAIIADTRKGSYEILLPKGSEKDIGKTIKIKDSYGSWEGKSIRIKPSTGNSINGSTKVLQLKKNYLFVTMEYTENGRWVYNDSVYLDKVTVGSTRTSMAKEYLVITETQSNFPSVFDGQEYNKDNLEVYRRGNKLYYGETFNENSEYGSLNDKGELVALDGLSVALRSPANKGDSIFFKSYTGIVEQHQAIYNSGSIIIQYESSYIEADGDNKEGILIVDRAEIENNISSGMPTIDIPFSLFGVDVFDVVNTKSLDVYRNGILLLKSGEANSLGYHCVGAEGNNSQICEYNGGIWTMDEENSDYNVIFENGLPLGIRMYTDISNKDIISIKWLNHVVGTVTTMDEIHEEMSNNFVHSQDNFFVSKQIKLSDIDDPTQNSVVHIGGEKEVRPKGVSDIIEMLYPVGTMYMNALNKESPKYILGFGEWRRMSGRVIAGFSDDGDALYGLNNNHLDSSGNPTKTTGGTIGSNTTKIKVSNIPELKLKDKFLYNDPNGKHSFGACMSDPDDESELLDKYSEKEIIINSGITEETVDTISLIQPTVIVSMWMRVE